MTRYKTYGFDNPRFFTSHSQGGEESGDEGWARITAKGYREYLLGIAPRRSALVVVDMTLGCVKDWGTAIAKYNKEIGEAFDRRMFNITLPKVVRLVEFFRKKDLLSIFLTFGRDEIVPRLRVRANEIVVGNYCFSHFRKYAPITGPGRTRTCDQSIMSRLL